MTSQGYAALTLETLPARLGAVAAARARLGDPAGWRAREVGDGNLNLVFIVEGPEGAVVVKQALPYVRLVGESWPLPLSRSFFEHEALVRHAARDPGATPEVFHFDREQALIVMEFLDRHVILRRPMIEGRRIAGLGRRLGLFCARTLFRGSDLAMPTADRKADLALFAGNVALCDITENLVFSDPYCDAPMNRHTPGLDALVAQLRGDVAMKRTAQHMKWAFATRAETLLHGDLHTGSVMVCDDDIRVIDPEFATYGPMGFDIGMLIANFLMAFCAQPGHASAPGARDGYADWLLGETAAIWSAFAEEFTRLWRTERSGMLYEARLFEDQGHDLGAEQARLERLGAVWRDALGFCGVEMHRRILGLAHNADFETIADEAVRAACEARALEIGRVLALSRDAAPDMAAALETAREIAARDVLGAPRLGTRDR